MMNLYDAFHTVSVLTLGCRANQYESDAIAAALCADGFVLVPVGDECDICIVNTCTVTSESDRKSRQMIRRCRSFARHVLVTGCFAEVSPESAAAIDGVDAVIGNKNKSEIILAAKRIAESKDANLRIPDRFEDCGSLRCVAPQRVRAYIKIEDGCENHCAYCIIPKARGPVRSKASAQVISEAEELAKRGIREVILTGIETASYGADINTGGSEYGLSDLVSDVSKIDGIERIGMGSLDPSVMRGDFPKRLAKIQEVLLHFHLSLQSGCSRTLNAMRRRYNASQAAEFISAIREAIPDVFLSADIIAGFPGETDEDFADTLAFLKRERLFHLHVFPYSRREGTEAASMPSQIPEKIKHERVRAISEMQGEIKRSVLTDYVQKHRQEPVYVLAEEIKNGMLCGHSEHFAEVTLPGDESMIGKIIPVYLSSTDGIICTGEIKS